MNKPTLSTIVVSAVCVATAAALTVAGVVGANRHDEPVPSTTTVYVGVHLPESVSRDIAAHGGINACPTEDSDDCYFDAVSRSNNLGNSFVVWKGKYYDGPDITLAACDLNPQPAYTSIERCIDKGGNVVARDTQYFSH